MPVFGYHLGPISIYSDVYSGGGNSSKPINEFDPVNKEIFAGEAVKWSNPTAGAPYPHIVAFVSNQSTELNSKISNITKPLQSSNLQSVITNLNKLLVEDDKENNKSNPTFNSRSIVFPSVINSSDLSVIYLDASGNRLFKGAEYNMTGNETLVNSGIIWAGGVIPAKFAKINSFIVTFMNPGTYHYQCLIYPDMKGTIIVKPNPGKLGIHIK
jgi:plastocyanin